MVMNVCTLSTPERNRQENYNFEASLDCIKRAQKTVAGAGDTGEMTGQGGGSVWFTPVISALGRLKQVNLCEFKATLIYTVSSRTARGGKNNTRKKCNTEID